MNTNLEAVDRVEQAIADIAAGKPVVVVDDADREDEGDLIFAAQAATPELVAFMMTHCRGLICVPLTGAACDRLGLPAAWLRNEDAHGTAFTVSVDARTGVTTGISAADRAHTIRVLADPTSVSVDLARPGHVFPLRARPGGVLERPGHTEAAVDLTRLAGRAPAAAICEIADEHGEMMRLSDLRTFAADHDLTLIHIADLIAYRQRFDPLVIRVSEANLPTRFGVFRAVGFRDAAGDEHVALVHGDLGDGEDVLVRVHSECLTGDTFASLRCDCGSQLDQAMVAVVAAGAGVVVYTRGHEGRGIGLLAKLRAYELQDAGADTVDANVELGLPVDARRWAVPGVILRQLGIRSMRLLTNNPGKAAELKPYGPTLLERVPMPVTVTDANLRYLLTKRDRMGHDLPDLPARPVLGGAR